MFVKINQLVELLENVINETMMNNRDNITNDNTTYIYFYWIIFSTFIYWICICFRRFACFKWIKGKKLFKNKYTDVFSARLSRSY